MRRGVAPTSTLADARGNNIKARAYLRSGSRQRAVVSFPLKEIGVTAGDTRVDPTPTHPGERTHRGQQIHCRAVTWSGQSGRHMNVLPFDQQVRIIAALTEGCSIRSTERLLGVHRDSIMRLSLHVGHGCARLHDRLMHDLQVNLIELDEQWVLSPKNSGTLSRAIPMRLAMCGFVVLAATQKAVISYVVGKRIAENAQALMLDLRARILNRPQISSDGFPPYDAAVGDAFGVGRGLRQIVKPAMNIAK